MSMETITGQAFMMPGARDDGRRDRLPPSVEIREAAEFVTDDVHQVTGHPPRTVEAYLAEISPEIRLPEDTTLAARG